MYYGVCCGHSHRQMRSGLQKAEKAQPFQTGCEVQRARWVDGQEGGGQGAGREVRTTLIKVSWESCSEGQRHALLDEEPKPCKSRL